MADLFLDGTKLLHHLPVVNRWLKGEDIFPIHVEISPSSGCNQRCKLCCVEWAGHKPVNLEKNIMLGLMDSFARVGVKSFLLAGEGEPLLNPHCREVATKAKSLGIDAALNTNALLLSLELSKDLLPGLIWARFSIQAADPQKYAYLHGTKEEDFSKVIDNIAKAVQIKRKNNLAVTLGIQQILMDDNWQEVYRIAKLSKDLGVDYFVVKRFSMHPKNSYQVSMNIPQKCEEIFEQTASLSDKDFTSIVRWQNFQDDGIPAYKQCLGLHFVAPILANGKIYTCCNFSRDERFCYGDLHEKSFEEIWQGKRRKEIVEFVETKIDPKKCMSFCRHHSINKFLWSLKQRPQHINFI